MGLNFYTLTMIYLGTFTIIIGAVWMMAGHFDKKNDAEKKRKSLYLNEKTSDDLDNL